MTRANATAALKLKSTFALLDVQTGRGKLLAALKKGKPVKVVVHGTIVNAWGGFDGESQEFSVDVSSAKATVQS